MSISRSLFVLTILIVSMMPSWLARAACGKVISVDTHDGTVTAVTLAGLSGTSGKAVVLLVGGSGYMALGRDGCPQKLKGNSLIRMRPLFHARGVITALVDAPSDHHNRDGLGGFRIDPAHAEDIGKVIATVRRRTGGEVWLAGTSRGTISAANAASRLRQPGARPDGVILTSPLTLGADHALKPWVEQDVFDLPLDAITLPVLVVAHREDKCIRTPPALGQDIIEKTESAREQFAVVTGGPGWSGGEGVEACIGKSPHGFLDQEEYVTEGIVRFMSGGAF